MLFRGRGTEKAAAADWFKSGQAAISFTNSDEMRAWVTLLLLASAAATLIAAENTALDEKVQKPTPPLRSRSEVERALSKQPASSNLRALSVVLVASKQDHGPGEHDYPVWQKQWHALLSQAPKLTVTNAWLWPSPEQFANASILVFYYWNHDWNAERFAQLDSFMDRGGGVVLLHSSSIADSNPEALAEHIGIAFQPKRSKYRHGELDLKLAAAPGHLLLNRLPRSIHFLDETYWPMVGETNKVEVLATAEEEGQSWPMIWTINHGKGHLFGTVLGHYITTFDDPWFRMLILRAMAWSANEPASRLESLVTSGGRFAD